MCPHPGVEKCSELMPLPVRSFNTLVDHPRSKWLSSCLSAVMLYRKTSSCGKSPKLYAQTATNKEFNLTFPAFRQFHLPGTSSGRCCRRSPLCLSCTGGARAKVHYRSGHLGRKRLRKQLQALSWLLGTMMRMKCEFLEICLRVWHGDLFERVGRAGVCMKCQVVMCRGTAFAKQETSAFQTQCGDM